MEIFRLQGTKLFVRIAINLSRGESIILHPTTPAALQPNPMHIVIICLPEQQHFLKKPSILKAILGRYPKSSKNVNKGKNIAIGGSITAIIQVRVWYTPDISISDSQAGECTNSAKYTSLFWIQENIKKRALEG